MNRKSLDKLKFVPYAEIDSLPQSTGVYLICINDAVLYVGSAKNIRSRLRTHHKTADITRITRWACQHKVSAPNALTVRWKLCDAIEQARQIENECIAELVPTLNWIESRENYISFLEKKANVQFLA